MTRIDAKDGGQKNVQINFLISPNDRNWLVGHCFSLLK